MSKPSGQLDLFGLCAFVAHHAPGLGDPMAMPIDVLFAHVHAVGEMLTRNPRGVR